MFQTCIGDFSNRWLRWVELSHNSAISEIQPVVTKQIHFIQYSSSHMKKKLNHARNKVMGPLLADQQLEILCRAVGTRAYWQANINYWLASINNEAERNNLIREGDDKEPTLRQLHALDVLWIGERRNMQMLITSRVKIRLIWLVHFTLVMQATLPSTWFMSAT